MLYGRKLFKEKGEGAKKDGREGEAYRGWRRGEAHVLDDADEPAVGRDFNEMLCFPLAEGETLILGLIIHRLTRLMSNVTHPVWIVF